MGPSTLASLSLFSLAVSFWALVGLTVLVRHRAVVIPSLWLSVLGAVVFVPSLVVPFATALVRGEGWEGGFWWGPVVFLAAVVAAGVTFRGFSVFGLGAWDLRQLTLRALDALDVRYQTDGDRIWLTDLGAEVKVSSQDWLGTGVVRSSREDRFPTLRLRSAFGRLLRQGGPAPRLVTATLYLGASLVLAGGCGLVYWALTSRPGT